MIKFSSPNRSIFYKFAMFGAFLGQVSPAYALCDTSFSNGIASVAQTWLKAEARNVKPSATAMNPGSFELWLRPRENGCISTSFMKGLVVTKDGQETGVQPYPKCDTSKWGKSIIALSGGERRNDGTVAYIGRIPLYRGVEDTDHPYDYMLVLNADGTINKFCTDSISGTFAYGKSNYWDRPHTD